MMTRMASVTSGQKFHALMLRYRLTSENIPTSESSTLATICILSAQLRPRRIISPKSAGTQARGHAMMNNSALLRIGLWPGIFTGLDWPKTVAMIGVNKICTVSPQSKATAMPIPCGGGSSFVAVAIRPDSCDSFKAAFPFLIEGISPENRDMFLVHLACYHH